MSVSKAENVLEISSLSMQCAPGEMSRRRAIRIDVNIEVRLRREQQQRSVVKLRFDASAAVDKNSLHL